MVKILNKCALIQIFKKYDEKLDDWTKQKVSHLDDYIIHCYVSRMTSTT